MKSDKKIISNILLMSQSYTEYLASFLTWAKDTVSAPYRVIVDKAYDGYYNGISDDNQIQRVFPKSTTTESLLSYFSHPTEIYKRIYLGSAINAASEETLKQLNIKFIVNVTEEISNYHPNSFTYYNIKIRDDNKQSIKKHFLESFNKIEEFLNNNPDGNILVHCFKGASRSATIVINYVSKKEGIDVTQVLSDIKKKRPIVNITSKYLEDLNDLIYDDEDGHVADGHVADGHVVENEDQKESEL